MELWGTKKAECFVHPQPNIERQEPPAIAPVIGKQKGQRPREVWRQRPQSTAFVDGLEDELEFKLLKVAQTTVDEFGRLR